MSFFARIEANLKRTSNTSCQNDTLTYRDIEINNSLVYIKEVLVSFTSTELKILRLLLQYPQKFFSKQNLYESIWNETYAYDDDTINTHISHIRKKLRRLQMKIIYKPFGESVIKLNNFRFSLDLSDIVA